MWGVLALLFSKCCDMGSIGVDLISTNTPHTDSLACCVTLGVLALINQQVLCDMEITGTN